MANIKISKSSNVGNALLLAYTVKDPQQDVLTVKLASFFWTRIALLDVRQLECIFKIQFYESVIYATQTVWNARILQRHAQAAINPYSYF